MQPSLSRTSSNAVGTVTVVLVSFPRQTQVASSPRVSNAHDYHIFSLFKVVDLMLRLPEAMQRQLSDAISIIGKYDFPAKWMDLFPYMVSKFASGDFHVINGVLRTANPLFKRYKLIFILCFSFSHTKQISL